MEDTETTKLIYQSPTTDWIICKQKNLWLGDTIPSEFYLVSKYEKFNPLVSDVFGRRWIDYKVVYFAEDLEKAFHWLRKNNIISKDEEKFQVARLTCPETLLDIMQQTIENGKLQTPSTAQNSNGNANS